jgi:hypothetical protein
MVEGVRAACLHARRRRPLGNRPSPPRPKLDASMMAGNAEHPIGAAAVKEFLQGDALTGWAMYIKTQETSDGGKGWYWYEVFDVTPGASAIGGQGSSTCTGCHSSGKDFVRVPYPLE